MKLQQWATCAKLPQDAAPEPPGRRLLTSVPVFARASGEWEWQLSVQGVRYSSHSLAKRKTTMLAPITSRRAGALLITTLALLAAWCFGTPGQPADLPPSPQLEKEELSRQADEYALAREKVFRADLEMQ